MKRLLALFCCSQLLAAVEWQTVAGSRRSVLWQQPDYFMQTQLMYAGMNAGLYYDEDILAFGEGHYHSDFLALRAGHLSQTPGAGFLLSNGGFLPQFASLATERPLGATMKIAEEGFFSFSGAWYEQPVSHRQLSLGEGSLELNAFWHIALGLYRTGKKEHYFMRSRLVPFERLQANLIVLQNQDWQTDFFWHFRSLRFTALAFRNHNPQDFQAGIYRRYREALQVMLEHENLLLRHLEFSDGRRTLGRINFSNAALFHLEHENRISLSGVGYENPQHGFHPLLHTYLSRIDRSWQISLGWNYGKLAKVAWVTGYAERFHPVDPLFWPAFSDIQNMREDNLLYFRSHLLGFEASVELQGFCFYALVFQNRDSNKAQKLEALLRLGFNHVFAVD